MMFFFQFVLVISFIFLIAYTAYREYTVNKQWADKFKEGTKVYTLSDEDGVVICIKGNKAFVRFFHGSYWKDLDDLVPYGNILD